MIVVGAMGGSGTRVVADILIGAGVNMGRNLNRANDNLLFTALFRNPTWYVNASEEEIIDRIKLFESISISGNYSTTDYLRFCRAILDNSFYPYSKAKMMYNILFAKSINKREVWGFKEPNAHIYVDHIFKYNPNFKYIHVIRHGLDMAFSKNMHQLSNWGFLYGINDIEENSQNKLYQRQLDFWIRSNTKAIETGKEILKNNFYLLNHKKLCEKPNESISDLLDFLDIKIDDSTFKILTEKPKSPSTSDRYKENDLSIFSEQQLDKVESLGFSIN